MAGVRTAFFTDSYHEVNGVGLTSRQLEACARKANLPFYCFYATNPGKTASAEPGVRLPLERGCGTIRVERDLGFDLNMWRHDEVVTEALAGFRPDLIHVTGPGDIGLLGAYMAHYHGIPLIASWHTNLHEYARWRLAGAGGERLGSFVEELALNAVLLFYKRAEVLLAPNAELLQLLTARTGKPVFLMQRGVDTDLFCPSKRTLHDGLFRVGFVGRLSPEKNVRFLAQIEAALRARGFDDYRFLIVGDGSELNWLRTNLRHADFPGILKGESLAEAYANMDVFAFPSATDTFGNVVLEASASGVPCVVTHHGGPKFLVDDGISGHVAKDEREFIEAVLDLKSSPERRSQMQAEARRKALDASWDRVFTEVYRAYETTIALYATRRSRETGFARSYVLLGKDDNLPGRSNLKRVV